MTFFAAADSISIIHNCPRSVGFCQASRSPGYMEHARVGSACGRVGVFPCFNCGFVKKKKEKGDMQLLSGGSGHS